MRTLFAFTAFFLSAATSAAQIPGTWATEPGELPEMRLVFEADGKLRFEVGFIFWNTGRWEYDSATHELKVTIPKLRAEDGGAFQEDAERGSIKSFDVKKKTVVYQYSDSTHTLSFAGFLYRAEGPHDRTP